MKECFKCGASKPLTDFYKNSGMSDGTVNKCKECNKADVRANREKNVDYYRAYDVDRYKNNPDVAVRVAKYAAEWNKKHPDRYRAHYLVTNAVRDGRLSKPSSCSECGDEHRRIHGHHEDYSKPLDVIWLCPPCHSKRHL